MDPDCQILYWSGDLPDDAEDGYVDLISVRVDVDAAGELVMDTWEEQWEGPQTGYEQNHPTFPDMVEFWQRAASGSWLKARLIHFEIIEKHTKTQDRIYGTREAIKGERAARAATRMRIAVLRHAYATPAANRKAAIALAADWAGDAEEFRDTLSGILSTEHSPR